jgi:hypothetical protein
MVRGNQIIKDDPIGKVSIHTVDKDGKVIERDLGKINEMEICPDCISKLIESFVKKGIAEQPDPSEMEKKAPEEPEPDADQREDTVDKAPAAPEEKQVDLTKFEPAEVHEDKPKSSVRMITPETRKQIRDLAKDGKSAREISELTGVSIPTANKYMRRATE